MEHNLYIIILNTFLIFLSLAFVRNVSLLQHTPVTASQGQNSVHGIDVL